jgi:hypothetical protein
MKSKNEAQCQATRAIAAILCQRWPKCFDLKNRRPLKIGIAHDLMHELGDAVSRPELKGALRTAAILSICPPCGLAHRASISTAARLVPSAMRMSFARQHA